MKPTPADPHAMTHASDSVTAPPPVVRGSVEPPAVWLDDTGVILECSPALASLFGYTRPELVSQHVSVVLPDLSTAYAFRDGALNPMLAFLCHLGHPFHALKRNGEAFGAELHFVENTRNGVKATRLLVLPQSGRTPEPLAEPGPKKEGGN